MRRHAHILLAAALFIGSGCKDDPPPPKPEPTPKEEPTAPEPEPHPLMQMRQAYGLPFPPEVAYVRKGPNYIEVGTKLRVDELRTFFAARLVDYEFIEVGKWDLRIIGLHSTMPRIRILKRAPRMPIVVRYTEQTGALEAERTAKKEYVKPKPGAPVDTKLGDGTPLAPGAVYGKPYTPKPGDPLYQDRYRANFGKPYGTWVLN